MNVSMIAVLWKRTGEDVLLRQETGENVFGFWQRKACGSMACLSWREFVLLIETVCIEVGVKSLRQHHQMLSAERQVFNS